MYNIKNSTPHDWDKNETKRQNDCYLNRFIAPLMYHLRDVDRAANVLSLPAARWSWEQNLANFFPNNKFNFFGCERNRIFFSMAQSLSIDLNRIYKKRVNFQMANTARDIKFALADSPTMGLKNTGPFDIVYIDHMGFPCPKKFQDIYTLYSNPKNCGSRSIFIMTLGLKLRQSKSFCEKLLCKWSKNKELMNEVHVDDDHFYQRNIDKKTYSSDIVPLVQAIALEVKFIAENICNIPFIQIHNPHIYYGPTQGGKNSVTQVSFCFTRMV
jgi:hypothetical protein